MFCHNCGTEISESQAFCHGCGTRIDLSPPASAKKSKKGKAIASMVLGICSFMFSCTDLYNIYSLTVALICGIIGLTLGIIALRSSGSNQVKFGMALTGVIFSSAAFFFVAVGIVLNIMIAIIYGIGTVFAS